MIFFLHYHGNLFERLADALVVPLSSLCLKSLMSLQQWHQQRYRREILGREGGVENVISISVFSLFF